jgi:hypothetical protein
LLLTDFVTDLRAAINNAADGRPTNADPLLIRSQLARLLRQAGNDDLARREASAVLKNLAVVPLPSGQKPEDSPLATEVKAAASEAMGDDLRAAEAFAHRVELQARSIDVNFQQAWIDWLRDWWVGRAYAQCVLRSGRSEEIERGLRESLAKGPESGSNLMDERVRGILLAFLLEAKGKETLARAQWQSLLPRSRQQASSSPASPQEVTPKTGI